MAGESDIPYEVRTLLHRSLPTMVHIELLLLLQRTVPEEWTAQRAAYELRSSPELMSAALDDLVQARLAEPGAAHGAFRFDASDDNVISTVLALKEEYDRRPVTLVKALYNRPPAGAQAFADAFRIRPQGR